MTFLKIIILKVRCFNSSTATIIQECYNEKFLYTAVIPLRPHCYICLCHVYGLCFHCPVHHVGVFCSSHTYYCMYLLYIFLSSSHPVLASDLAKVKSSMQESLLQDLYYFIKFLKKQKNMQLSKTYPQTHMHTKHIYLLSTIISLNCIRQNDK